MAQPKKKAAVAGSTALFPVLSPIKAGGKRYEVGDEVELALSEADVLQKAGVVGEALSEDPATGQTQS